MSINELTNAAIARRLDFHPADTVPQNYKEIALAAGVTPAPVVAAAQAPLGPDAAVAQRPAPPAVNTALQTLTTYIPTEVLTLYVAVVAILGPLKGQAGKLIGRWPPFWTFFVATPLIAWLVFAAKVKAKKKRIPWRWTAWPLWEMTAATIAYAAWAFALPNTPFLQEGWYSPGIAGLAVLLASSVLGLLSPLMQRTLSQ